jgi:acetolactate synthase-1/2/3 large subunit
MRGSKALLELLEQQGVDVMFGIPGGTTMPIYDDLLDSNIRHVLVRHEQREGSEFAVRPPAPEQPTW